MDVINFMSYNSTGLDLQKVTWINDLMTTCGVSCFQLQEHFKSSKSVESYFKREFKNYSSYVIPAYREASIGTGRAKGGLVQMMAKDINIKKEKIPSRSWRIQAQVLHIASYRILWINCYFPTDNFAVICNDKELGETLDALENILDSNVYNDCIIGGDFNFDMRRNTGFVNAVKQFLDEAGLKSVWNKFNVDYTHIHTDQRSVSTIDHFFVNQRLLDCVIDAGAMHFGDNLSRHSPIMIKLKIPKLTEKVQTPNNIEFRRPAWYKANQDEKNLYRAALSKNLANLQLPESIHCCSTNCDSSDHTKERDRLLLDIVSCVNETSYKYIPLQARKRPTTSGFVTSCQPLPGWKENIAPLKRDSIFWHSVWRSAGRPSSGALHNLMISTRGKYHYAIKVAKRMVMKTKADNLEAACCVSALQQ